MPIFGNIVRVLRRVGPAKFQRDHDGVIDQRQQQIDPAGKNRQDPDARQAGSMKQPGRSETPPAAKPSPTTE